MVDATNSSEENLQNDGGDSVHKQIGGWKEHSLSPKEETEWMVDRAEAAGVELTKGDDTETSDAFDKIHLDLVKYHEDLTEATVNRGTNKTWWNLVGAVGGGLGAMQGFLIQGKKIGERTDKVYNAVLSEVKANASIFHDISSIKRGAKNDEITSIAKKWIDTTKLTDDSLKQKATDWLNEAFQQVRNKTPDTLDLTKKRLSEDVANAVQPFEKRIEKLFKYVIDADKQDHGAVFDEVVKNRVVKSLENNGMNPLSDNVMGKVKEYYVDFVKNGNIVSSVNVKDTIRRAERGNTGTFAFRAPAVIATVVAGVIVSDLIYNMTHGKEQRHIDLLKNKVDDINYVVKLHDKPGVEVSLPSKKITERVENKTSSHISTKV